MRAAQALMLMASMVSLAACTLLTGADDLTLAEDGTYFTEASVDQSVPDANDTDARSASDGPPIVDSCSGGATRLPISVELGPTVGTGSTCNLGAMLVVDGKVGGLDIESGVPGFDIDGNNVVACARLDFAREHAAASITTTARSSRNACGAAACRVPDGCDTGRSFAVFVAGEAGAFKHIADVPTAPTLQTLSVPVPTTARVRYVLVCRRGFGWHRDDVEIDGVALVESVSCE